MDVFVTGVTGVLGSAATPRLLNAGHAVRALARDEEAASRLRAAGVEPVVGSLFDPDALQRGMGGVAAVLHLATRIPPSSRMDSRDAWAENDRIRTEGTRLIVAAAASAGVKTIAYPSVTLLYADGGDGWIEAPTAAVSPTWTTASSLEAESMVRAFGDARAGGIVLRLGMLYGPGTPVAATLLEEARRGFSGIVGATDGYQSSLWTEDAGAALVAALRVPPGIYDVVDDQPMRRREIDEVLARLVGRRSLRRPPPAVESALAGSGASFLLSSHRVSNRRFRDASAWTPQVPSMREGLAIASGDDVPANPPSAGRLARERIGPPAR